MSGRVVVAMSGGVDSSCAALLARETGDEVLGVTLRLYDPGATSGTQRSRSCCSPGEIADAARVARSLGIAHHVLDYAEGFANDVVQPFVREYLAGRTPNPCVLCNERVKFGRLLEAAERLGADELVTGHYARVVSGGASSVRLLRGLDPAKDQSYFLFAVARSRLARVRFPLGGLRKDEVRARALGAGLPVAEKPESQEICFVGDDGPQRFVERVAGTAATTSRAGSIVDEAGRVVGAHAGVHRFTVGQRRGLGLGGGPTRYVVGLDAATERVVVGPRAALARTEVVASRPNWLTVRPLPAGTRVAAQIRSRHRPAAARVVEASDAGLRLRFDEPQEAVTPGQAVVLYHGDRVLGGAWIERAA